MKNIKNIFGYFTKTEKIIWLLSEFLIVLSFVLFDGKNYMAVSSSAIGVTSLIFSAKGNPVGQLLSIIFCMLYAVISYKFSYYGEIITYLGMTMPMAIISFIAWIRNPFNGNKFEVTVNDICRRDIISMGIFTIVVTVFFGIILIRLNTANIVPSIISVTTSFSAMYLSYKRSPYYALSYALNDVILIVLWSLAAMHSKSYISVVACFIAFLINDMYTFINWCRIAEKQKSF